VLTRSLPLVSPLRGRATLGPPEAPRASGSHPLVLLVELARRDDVAGSAQRGELAAETEAETTRFVDDVDLVPTSEELLDEGHELLGPEAARRLWRRVVVLGHAHVAGLVHVHSELDRRRLSLMVLVGGCECGRPFVMNDCFNHTLVTGELPRSPVSFHAIQALQRTRSAVTAAASGLRVATTVQPPRQLRASLSLRALGASARFP